MKMNECWRLNENLNNVSLIQKCKINGLIENRMTNETASEKFGIPRSTILTWMKIKNKLFTKTRTNPVKYKETSRM